MLGWLKKLIGGVSASVPQQAVGPASSRPRPDAPALRAAAMAPDGGGFGCRRPLVGRDGRIGAWQFMLPVSAQARSAAADGPAKAASQAALQVALLSSAARAVPAGGVLVRMPADLLARPAVAAAAASGTWIVVDGLAQLPADTAAALRARGVRLGLADGPPQREPAPDLVLLQAQAGGIDTLLLSGQRWREVHPGAVLVAVGLACLDDVECALRSGLHWAGGDLCRSTGAPPLRDLGAPAHRICELLNHLAMDRDTAVIGDAARADVALAYRLLRYANSAAIGLPRPVETVDQAVLVLGRAELVRWLTVQLLACTASRQASHALQTSALARGRLLEALAEVRGDADPGAHYTLGVLSLIEALLQVPMAVAVAPLRLSAQASDALLHGRGPWAGRLALLQALDQGDVAAVDALAAALGVAGLLPALNEQAWRWAAAVSDAESEAA